jgi:hypothetical protein
MLISLFLWREHHEPRCLSKAYLFKRKGTVTPFKNQPRYLNMEKTKKEENGEKASGTHGLSKLSMM